MVAETGETQKRTAVLVVHGMGSQRPLDTVRGMVDAVWRDEDSNRKVWVHPEPSGIDLDLAVFTTNARPESGGRNVDFRELYWAHLLSETRAVAVLLWMFELCRRGPRLNSRMIIIWWGGAVFLALLILSIAYLAVQAVERLANVVNEPQAMLYALLLMPLVVTLALLAFSIFKGAFRFAAYAFCALLLIAGVIYLLPIVLPGEQLNVMTRNLLPPLVALVGARIVMGWWGVLATGLAYLLLLVFLSIQLFYWSQTFAVAWDRGWMPWSLESEWSAVCAWLIIFTYLALNAAFLKAYIGDAARYFRNSPANVLGRREIRRQAVAMLEELHISGRYDRIIIVAHSLGTVVAYDMLRFYYGRICRNLPPADVATFGNDIVAVYEGRGTRDMGREIIRRMAALLGADRTPQSLEGKDSSTSRPKPTAWLVTDFVTLGSPLSHAVYLMCRGDELDFARRKQEHEFPTCPPQKVDEDGLLTYTPRNLPLRFHHGGMFALTRWTNLYFPMSQVLWGDPVGGPLRDTFGDAIVDREVSTRSPPGADFFTHTAYWDIARDGGRNTPHILALREAINLEDRIERREEQRG